MDGGLTVGGLWVGGLEGWFPGFPLPPQGTQSRAIGVAVEIKNIEMRRREVSCLEDSIVTHSLTQCVWCNV